MTTAVMQRERVGRSGRQPAAVEATRDAREELVARRHEAGQFTAAVRTVVRQLESILLRPTVEVPPDALQLTMQLRAMSDRYARRWEPES
jgi:hypothetical protein